MNKNSIEKERMLPPRQQRAAEAEKKFSKAWIKLADKCKGTSSLKEDNEMALALHFEHTFVLGTDPLAMLVIQRRKGATHG